MANAGTKWTKQEETQLIQEISQYNDSKKNENIENKTLLDIATLHKRSIGSISSRIYIIGANMVINKEKTIEETVDFFNIINLNNIELEIKIKYITQLTTQKQQTHSNTTIIKPKQNDNINECNSDTNTTTLINLQTSIDKLHAKFDTINSKIDLIITALTTKQINI